jgi:hypothetical protein
MIKKITIALSLFAGVSLSAQTTVHRVLVLNEGYFDFANQQQVVPVSVGSYDPATDIYTDVATIPGVRFGSDLEVDANGVFVAADTLLLKYDKDSYQLLGQTSVRGIRKIELWNNQVLVTRGELGGLPHYFEVRSAIDLSLLYTIDPSDGLLWSCEDIHVENSTAYIAIGNAFDFNALVGKIGTVDLLNQTLTGTIDLGPQGLNPENIMMDNGELFTLNNKDFGSSSISKVDIVNDQLDYTQNVTINSGCGASVMADDHIYYQEYNVAKLARFDYGTATVVDTLFNTVPYYGLLDDEVNGHLYATTTDFVSTGELRTLAYDGTVISSKTIGVAAGNLALDLRSSTGVTGQTQEEVSMVYLRDTEELLVSGDEVMIFGTSGQLLRSEAIGSGVTRMSLSDLPAGLYTARAGAGVYRFVK